MIGKIENEVIDFSARWKISDTECHEVLAAIRNDSDVLDRGNWAGHITASAMVVSARQRTCIGVQSRKFSKMLFPGGHIEPGELPIDAAKRELREEVGINFDEIKWVPFASDLVEINTHYVGARPDRNQPKHKHFDFVYLFRLNFFPESNFDVPESAVDEVDSIVVAPLERLYSEYTKAYSRTISLLGERQ